MIRDRPISSVGNAVTMVVPAASRTSSLRATVLVALLLVVVGIAGCSVGNHHDHARSGAAADTHMGAGRGPKFGECGGISVKEAETITGIRSLDLIAKNSVGCEWIVGPIATLGPHLSFSWYRGSPIGREHALEKLTRDKVKDITVGGFPGFQAMSHGLCEVGVQFGDDFIEWSLSTEGLTKPGDINGTTAVDANCPAVVRLAKLSIERSAK